MGFSINGKGVHEMSIAKVIVGKAWETNVRYTATGTCCCDFSVSEYSGKDKDGKAKYTNYKVKTFKEIAEAAGNALQKGQEVICVGNVEVEQWEKDGVKHSRLCLIANHVGVSIRQRGQAHEGENGYGFGQSVPDDQDIPF